MFVGWDVAPGCGDGFLGADNVWWGDERGGGCLVSFKFLTVTSVPSEFEPAWEINATTRNAGGKNKKNVPQGDYDVLCIRTGLL